MMKKYMAAGIVAISVIRSNHGMWVHRWKGHWKRCSTGSGTSRCGCDEGGSDKTKNIERQR